MKPHRSTEPIGAKIERSSLGTPEARRVRSKVPDSAARAVTQKAAAYPREIRRRQGGG